MSTWLIQVLIMPYLSLYSRLILAVFAAINYGKIIIVDDKLKTIHCFVFSRTEASSSGYASTSSYSNDYSKSDFSSSEYTENNSRLLASKSAYSEADLCREYFLSYSVFCAFMLTLFLTSLLIVSEVYMRRLLEKVLEMEIDLEWQDVEEFEEEEALEYLAAEYELQQLELNKSVANGTPAQDTSAKDGVILVPMLTPSHEVDKTTDILSIVPALTPQQEQVEQHVPPEILGPDSIPLIPHRDPDPPVFSLQDPESMKPRKTSTEHLILPAPVDISSNDDIPLPTIRPINPPFKSDHTDIYSRRRSATSAPLHEGGMPYRLSKQASGLGPVTERRRAASYSRARSASINFRHPDGVIPYPLQKAVSTVGSVAGDGDSRVDCVTPRLPPASVMQEHAQHLKDIGRARSNTFIHYMSNSLPVSLLSSRYALYQHRVVLWYPLLYCIT
jgi:hypothetical protein